ncbi:hypothetical protein FJTKL_14729 [Diaporthe vaccinii]|uniref:Uncharacterized protein n=1 Tax=Diaporthe vaccinii TaxID=105482 RepID=A0ABR4F887_9PEZI
MNNQSSSKASRANRTWQDGEIAFLKSSEYFLAKDHQHLIASGHLHVKATGHPVIILKAGPGRAIVTTITAFNSGPQNNFLPPWRMRAHQEKHLDDYHAFIGTQLPPKSPNAHLKLSDSGAKMNKPRASWVYIKHLYTVPYTVLLRWNKVPQQLRVSEESLAQLRADIERNCGVYSTSWDISGSSGSSTPSASTTMPCTVSTSAACVPNGERHHSHEETLRKATSTLILWQRRGTPAYHQELVLSSCFNDWDIYSSGHVALMAPITSHTRASESIRAPI